MSMDKATIKQRIEEIQTEVVADLEKAFNRDLTSADIDEAETKDPEDFSHQTELNEMARTQELRLRKSRHDLRYVQDLPDEKSELVEEGALIETESYFFYVGIAVHPFKVDDRPVAGISTESPIYRAMQGRTEGETFSYNNKTYTIKSIQ
jgi:hypothetical protein